jgi:pilus assembly protein CpaC
VPNKYNEAALFAATLLACAAFAQAQPHPAGPSTPLKPCQDVTVDAPTQLALGKSRVVRLPFPAARMVVGGQPTSRAGVAAPVGAASAPGRAPQQSRGGEWDGVAETDITLISPTELYFLGRRPGSMNVVVQSTDGRCLVKDIVVTIDPESVQAKILEVLPEETGLRVRAADHAIILTGTVSDSMRLDQVLSVATSYGDGKKVVNLLRVASPQQVMLEVKIAEISKTLLDRFGLDFTRIITKANGTSKILSGIVGGGSAVLGRLSGGTGAGVIDSAAVGVANGTAGAARSTLNTVGSRSSLLGIDAEARDGIIRVLAEPNIMAISGQSASFLSGGKIFIPVAQDRAGSGGVTITLEEKEFGVGLKFTPTVLDGSRINLKLVSEASELSQTGSPFTAMNGFTAILPSMATRRVDTTVQLNDGQSFVVAGLIKNNINETLSKFPGLGDVPVMGALFRSTEFQNDQTELMFVVTPRLVKPLQAPVMLPTDNHIPPTRGEVILQGTGESTAPPPMPPAQPAVVVPAPVPAKP